MHDKIKNHVHETLKNYGVGNRKLEKELVEACVDEYDMQIESGADSTNAFELAVGNIEEIAKSRVSPKNKFAFTFWISIAAFCLACLEMFFSILTASIEIYSSEIIAAMAGIVVTAIVYLIVKRRNYRWYDFVIMAIMLISWAVTYYMLLPTIMFNELPGSWHKLDFVFPCIFKHYIHRDWMAEGDYTVTSKFYPNFIVAFVLLVTTTTLYIRQHFIIKRSVAEDKE